jgi:hypothetical protein
MLFGVFDTLEDKGLIRIDPLPDCVRRLGLVFVYIVEKNISVSVKYRGLVSVENVQFPKNLFALGNVRRGRISPVASFITFVPKGKPMGEDMGENMAGPQCPVSAFNWFESGVIILLEQRPLHGEMTLEDLRPTDLVLLTDELLVRWVEIFHWKRAVVEPGSDATEQAFH